jgi:DNA-binding response OmpR family regulator
MRAHYELREFTYDAHTRRLFTAGDHYFNVPRQEGAVLSQLLEAGGRVVSVEEIRAAMPEWETWTYDEAMHCIHVLIARLRTRVGDGAIWTVKDVGYCINPKAAEVCPTCGRVK